MTRGTAMPAVPPRGPSFAEYVSAASVVAFLYCCVAVSVRGFQVRRFSFAASAAVPRVRCWSHPETGRTAAAKPRRHLKPGAPRIPPPRGRRHSRVPLPPRRPPRHAPASYAPASAQPPLRTALPLLARATRPSRPGLTPGRASH
jgi:hypothetical protein